MEDVKARLGDIADLELKREGKDIKLLVKRDDQLIGAEIALKLDAALLLDKLAGLIPGAVDDAIIAALKEAFLK